MLSRKLILKSAVLFLLASGYAYLGCAQAIPKAGANFHLGHRQRRMDVVRQSRCRLPRRHVQETYMGWISNAGLSPSRLTTTLRVPWQPKPCRPWPPTITAIQAFSCVRTAGSWYLSPATTARHLTCTFQQVRRTSPRSAGGSITPGDLHCYPNPMFLSAEGDSGRIYCFTEAWTQTMFFVQR